MRSLFKDHRLYKLLLANILSSIGSGITMIAIPWLMVNRDGGEQIFGYAALFMSLILFIVSPYVGVLIDRFSRKKVLLISEVFGFTVVLSSAIYGFVTGHFAIWQLIIVYCGGSMYYTLHFPSKFAFNQEIFERSQYKSLNSLMEIQSQSSSMVAGGIASLLIERIDLSYLLFIDASTYMGAFLLIATIPYVSKVKKKVKQVSMFADIKEGFLYLKQKPILIVFLLCTYMPFIGVMIGNYVFPIYIAKTLQAEAAVMGMSDMIYAMGAVLAGFTIPLMMNKWGAYRTIIATVSIFTIGILTIAWMPIVGVFLVLKISLGWGNAGTRVARNTVIMELVPNEIVGRVNSFVNAVSLAARVSLIGIFSQTIAMIGPATGASVALTMMGCLLMLAVVGVFTSQGLFCREAESNMPKGVC